MSLASGTSLGPYEIVAPLGAGGMGEVYRARDTRLDRTVAVKILPASLASQVTRARFDREARAISGLTHANICALYDVGHHDGIDYLVMEYLEGESLADKLARGPLPLSQVTRYGAEIAQALHHAHRRGITHRDLKPGNIMITAGGVKLLDFGLARMIEPEAGESGQSETLTRKTPLTEEGMVVGTLPYMSPEHVEGRTVDHRSDIFSLGVILYEMIAGRRPFGGASKAALIASILASDPPSAPIPSPALERIIRTALEKNPDDRWQSAQDLARELRWASEASASTQPVTHPSRRGVPAWLIMLAIALAAGAAGWLMARRGAPPRGTEAPEHLAILVPPDTRLGTSGETNILAIAPDGRSVVYVAFTDTDTELFLRRLDSPKAHKIEGTEGATGPFWSDDGQWLGYSQGGRLWKKKLPSGVPQPLCEVKANGVVAHWKGDTILFSDRPGGRGEIYRVPVGGGPAVAVTKVDSRFDEVRHAWPLVLEDGRHFLYLSLKQGSIDRELVLASLDGKTRQVMATGVSKVRLSGDRMVSVREGKLIAQKFSIDEGLSGDPVTIAENVDFFYPPGGASFDVSNDGTAVYITNTATNNLAVWDRGGKQGRRFEGRGRFFAFDIAPDGRRAAVTIREPSTGLMDIWIYDLASGLHDRFTSDPGVETYPNWSPDGKRLVYSVGAGHPPLLVQRGLSETTAKRIESPGRFQIGGCFSRDGRSVYYTLTDPKSKRDILRVSLDGTKPAEEIVATEFNEFDPAISPDGRWLAFVGDSTGSAQVYVRDMATGERTRISDRGGFGPQWSASGELFYHTADSALVSARPGPAGGWDAAVTTELFRTREELGSFDVFPDGQSFLISEYKTGASDAYIQVAKGW